MEGKEGRENKEKTGKQDFRDELVAELQRLALDTRLIDEFDLESISTEASELLRPIAKKVNDRIDNHAQMLDLLLHPDNNLSSLTESSFIDDNARDAVVKSFRRLMLLVRRYNEAELWATPEMYESYLKQATTVWMSEKQAILGYIRKLQKGWESEEPLHAGNEYFG